PAHRHGAARTSFVAGPRAGTGAAALRAGSAAHDRTGPMPGAVRARPLSRPATGPGTGHGAGARAARGAAGRTHRRAEQDRARPHRRSAVVAGAYLWPVLPAGRARPRLRRRGGHPHRGAAPGAHRHGRQFPRRDRIRAGAHHLRGQRASRDRGDAAMSATMGPAAQAAPALAMEEVSSGYQSALVLREVSLAVAPGACVALLGKNGMGKSTLLKTVMGYLPKARGRVRLGGMDATRMRPQNIARRGVAYAAQAQALFPEPNIRDNPRQGQTSKPLFR